MSCGQLSEASLSFNPGFGNQRVVGDLHVSTSLACLLERHSTQMTTRKPHLVSVIIPCHNQAHFLGEAIESVQRQTYRHFEIIVVDDGSTDNTPEVAARYPDVRFIRQENQGVSVARNAGLRESAGSYLVFLDGDDRLLPDALGVGVNRLNTHPECAFVFGHYRLIASDGSPLSTPHRPWCDKDFYLQLLSRCIPMCATVMYQRIVFESVIGFNTFNRITEDYELYLRIARRFPIHCHDEVIAEYRRHHTNLSNDVAVMLKNVMIVLRSQWAFVNGNKNYEEAYRAGVRAWQACYGEPLINQVSRHLRGPRKQWKQAIRGLAGLLRYYPRGLIRHCGWKLYRGVLKANVDSLSGKP